MLSTDLINIVQSQEKIERTTSTSKLNTKEKDSGKNFDDVLKTKSRNIDSSKEYEKNHKKVVEKDSNKEVSSKDEEKKSKKEVLEDIMMLLNSSVNDNKIELKKELENLGLKALDENFKGEVTIEDITTAISSLLEDKLNLLNDSLKNKGENTLDTLKNLLQSSQEIELSPETIKEIETLMSKDLTLEDKAMEISKILSKDEGLDLSKLPNIEEEITKLFENDKNLDMSKVVELTKNHHETLEGDIKTLVNNTQEMSKLLIETINELVTKENIKNLVNKIKDNSDIYDSTIKANKYLIEEVALKITGNSEEQSKVKESEDFTPLLQKSTVNSLKLNNGFSNSKPNDDDLFLKEFISNSKEEPKVVPIATNIQTKLSFEDVMKVNNEIMISKETVVQDIEKAIKVMSDNSIKELAIKVNPKELGQVIIKIVVEGNTMKAEISAENKEAYSMMQSKIQELTEALSPHKISEVNINVFSESNTFDNKRENNNSQNGGSKNSNALVDLEDEFEEIPTIKEDNSTMEMYV